MIYLASPYTHPDPAVQQMRYEQAMAAQVQLLLRGFHVYSPIVACHPMALAYELPTDAWWWLHYNNDMIHRCRSVYVLRLDGWEQSVGVAEEIKYAEANKIPVFYIDFFDGVVPFDVNGELRCI